MCMRCSFICDFGLFFQHSCIVCVSVEQTTVLYVQCNKFLVEIIYPCNNDKNNIPDWLLFALNSPFPHPLRLDVFVQKTMSNLKVTLFMQSRLSFFPPFTFYTATKKNGRLFFFHAFGNKRLVWSSHVRSMHARIRALSVEKERQEEEDCCLAAPTFYAVLKTWGGKGRRGA